MSGWDISVGPDGIGLPRKRTALKGATVYEQKVPGCTRSRAAASRTIVSSAARGAWRQAPVRTIGSYWPYARPSSTTCAGRCRTPSRSRLTDDEVYALPAVPAQPNGHHRERERDERPDAAQKDANRENFIVVYPARRR